jgi:hypothetical protein
MVPTGVRAPSTVTGIPRTEIVRSIGGIERLAVSFPEVTSPSALSVDPARTSIEMPLFSVLGVPADCSLAGSKRGFRATEERFRTSEEWSRARLPA